MAMILQGDDIFLDVIAASIYEWNRDISYKHPSYVLGTDKRIYFSLKDSLNKDPLLNKGIYWEDYFNYNFQPKYDELVDEIDKKLDEIVKEVNKTPDWTEHDNDKLGQILDDGSLLIIKSGIFTSPATGLYSVGVVGGGGAGGNGTYSYRARGGAGGGGGGAGQFVSAFLPFNEGDKVNVSIAGPGGSTSFSTLTCNGGGRGGNGYHVYDSEGFYIYRGGALGSSYGTGGTAGISGNSTTMINGGTGANSLFPYSRITVASSGTNGYPDDESGWSWGYGGAPGTGYGAGGGGGGGSSNIAPGYGGSGAQGAAWIKRIS